MGRDQDRADAERLIEQQAQTIDDQEQRIARLERELAEARELARCGGWSK